LLGEKIATLRREKNLRQEDLAKLLGVSRQTISNYEKGERHPDPQMLSRLARFFNVSSDYLLDLTDDPTPNRPVCEGPSAHLGRGLSTPSDNTGDTHYEATNQLYILLKKLDKEDLFCLLHLIKRLAGLK